MLVVEKNLNVLGGHEVTQVFAIRSLVVNRPVTFVTGRHCELSLDDPSSVLTVLSTRKEIEDTPEHAVDHDLIAMQNILSSQMIPEANSVLYATAQAHELRVALRLVASFSLSQKIHMRVLLDREIAQLTDDERAALKSAVEAGQIVLLTETNSLATHFLERYGLECHETALCLPCSLLPGQATNLSSSVRSKAGPYRVGCLGGWRAEKGIKMLPQIIRHLRDALDAADDAPKVELIIQKPPRRRTFKSIKKWVKHDYPFWRSVGLPVLGKRLSLSFRTTKLSKVDFMATLMSVDVLLVPYCLDDYRHRGSGIILDGVAAGKPIVYTRGMGMSEFLIHGNAEPAIEDPKDYADKVVRIISDIEAYRTAAHQAALELNRRVELTASFLRSI